MRRNRHIGRPLGDRVVDHARIDLLQAVWIIAALARFPEFILRTEISPDGVVELQISATRIVKRLHRFAVGLREILKEHIEIGIHIFGDRVAATSEVQNRRRWDRHLRHHMRDLTLFFQEFEMVEHWMVVWKIELADHPDGIVPGLNACELDAGFGMKQFATGEPGEKIEVPPRSPELAVSREL